MKKSEQRDDRPKQGMTRAEFLSVGSAAAVGVAVPLGVMAEPVPEAPPGPMPAPDGPCGTDATIAWALPATHLNTLFGELLPRVAAAIWAGHQLPNGTTDIAWPPATNFGSTPDPDVVKQHIRENWIAYFNTDPAKQTKYTSPFLTRLEALDAYLNVKGRSVPIFFIERPGFDMVLSSQGLDLYPPPDITVFGGAALDELMRFYTYRTTGRPPIGLPRVLNSGIPPHIIAAATGASQMERAPDIVTVELIPTLQGMASLAGNTAEILRLCGMFDLLNTDDMWTRINDLDLDQGDAFLVDFLGMDRVSAREARNNFGSYQEFLVANRPEGPCTPPTDEWYACEKRKERCWQVSGAVYRGMLEQFPRLVAQSWFETPTTAPSVLLPATVTGPGATLRSRMRERLETALDPADRMFFGWDLPTPSDWTDVQDATGLNITNQGFHFAKPGLRPVLSECLTQIVQGKAGNPVFTDSSQTDA